MSKQPILVLSATEYENDLLTYDRRISKVSSEK